MTAKSVGVLFLALLARPAASGWSRHVAEGGRAYWWCATLGESHWDTPGTLACPPTPPPPHDPTTMMGSYSGSGPVRLAQIGWSDCGLAAASVWEPGGGASEGLRRAWRSLARAKHPDKPGGGAAAFHDAAAAKEALASPLRFLAYRALYTNATRAQGDGGGAGGAGGAGGGSGGSGGDGITTAAASSVAAMGALWPLLRVRTARATVVDRTGWPYLALNVDWEALPSAAEGSDRRGRQPIGRGSSYQVCSYE